MKITGYKTESMYRRYRIVDERDIKEATERMQAHLAEQVKPHQSVIVPIIDPGINTTKNKQERAQHMHSGSPVDLSADSKLLILHCGRIAQLVRALASHARGRRFESCCDHH